MRFSVEKLCLHANKHEILSGGCNFWATVCKMVHPMLSDCCPVLSVTLVYCGQTVGGIKMKLGMQAGVGLGHTVLDGDPVPPPLKGHSPQFSAHICYGQRAGWIKMLLGMEVGLSTGNFVLDGDPDLPSPKKGHSPQFLAHVYCGQMAGWIKMALGMEVGLGPGDIVLHRDPAPPKWGTAPQFSAHAYCGQTVAISATAEHL